LLNAAIPRPLAALLAALLGLEGVFRLLALQCLFLERPVPGAFLFGHLVTATLTEYVVNGLEAVESRLYGVVAHGGVLSFKSIFDMYEG